MKQVKMKKLFFLFIVTILTSVMSFGQMTEGHVSYEIDVWSNEEEMEMIEMTMSGSSLDLYFEDHKARTDMNMGTMMTLSVIVDDNSGEILMLMDGMLGKIAAKTSSDELNVEEPEIEIELTKEKKEIAGYECKKAIIKDAEGNEIEYWYTEDIKTSSTDVNSVVAKLPGLALMYSMNNSGLVMTYTAINVETSLSASDKKEKFSMEIPDGYTKMTLEEFAGMGGGM